MPPDGRCAQRRALMPPSAAPVSRLQSILIRRQLPLSSRRGRGGKLWARAGRAGGGQEEALGRFRYSSAKAGRLAERGPARPPCSLAHIFVMHVTEVLDKWPEHHKRTRHWVPPPPPPPCNGLKLPRRAAAVPSVRGRSDHWKMFPHAITSVAMLPVELVHPYASGLGRDIDGRSDPVLCSCPSRRPAPDASTSGFVKFWGSG